MKFIDLYNSNNKDLYTVAMTVEAIEKFFDPCTTDSELCALDLGCPQFAYDKREVCGFATVVQTDDPIEDEPIYYHLCCVFHNGTIYALMTNCPEPTMLAINPNTWEAKEYKQ